ncbi:MAG: sulfotransferase [Marmoricola sp.]
MATDPRPVVLYLAGIGRSGTTLIERTVAETAGVTALGEVMHLWDRGLVRGELCGCGREFKACPFWSAIGDKAFGGWDNVDPDRMAFLKGRVDRASRVPAIATGHPRSLDREVAEYVEHYEKLYRAAQELVGGVLVDSSKQVSLAWCLSRSDAIDLRVVHCVRDSRGVVSSWSRDITRPEAVSAEHELMPKYSPVAISALWMLHNLEIEALGRRVPLARLRYEDFVRAPEEGTRKVLDLAGVVDASTDHIHGRSVHLSEAHSCSGNPMRFKQGEIALVPDERWRRELSPARRRAVNAFTAPLLRRYGYGF